MIKHLHSKNTSSSKKHFPEGHRPKLEVNVPNMLEQLSKELLAPREEAIKAILSKAAATKSL